jgi:hypothetical protein
LTWITDENWRCIKKPDAFGQRGGLPGLYPGVLKKGSASDSFRLPTLSFRRAQPIPGAWSPHRAGVSLTHEPGGKCMREQRIVAGNKKAAN